MAKRKQKQSKDVKWAEGGERMARTRAAFDLNQIDFARKAKIKQSTYNQYETGAKRPSVDNAMALCDTYDLTLDWIYRGDPSSLPYKLANTLRELHRK